MAREVLREPGEGLHPNAEQKLAALSLSNMLRYRDPPPSYGEAKAHPGAETLFTLAQRSASRIQGELYGISHAVEEGNFGREEFEVTQRQVVREINADLIYLSAAKF